jgi:hypothetical protein
LNTEREKQRFSFLWSLIWHITQNKFQQREPEPGAATIKARPDDRQLFAPMAQGK